MCYRLEQTQQERAREQERLRQAAERAARDAAERKAAQAAPPPVERERETELEVQ